MSRRKKWVIGVGAALCVIVLVLVGLGLYFARRFEPFLREQTIAYLERRFQADVELAGLKVVLPLDSPLDILARGGKGAMVNISGESISLKLKSQPSRPPFLTMRKFSFEVDLNSALQKRGLVRHVRLEGLELSVAPKGERTAPAPATVAVESAPAVPVRIDDIQADGARLSIIPNDPAKEPLVFDIHKLRLDSAGPGVAMRYTAELTNAKPPGLVHSTGSFGPWNADSPAETPLAGSYQFRQADLSVFAGIAGTLASEGAFHGSLGRFDADGTAWVPDFQLKTAGNPVSLTTRFHAVVDGTNGNTLLDPVEARLGQSTFDLRGAVVRGAQSRGKTVDLDARFRQGRLDDVLLLAVKGAAPVVRGGLELRVKITVPPGQGPIENRLRLAGTFRLIDARFTNHEIQNELDVLSRRAQGRPTDTGVDEVPWQIGGDFQMAAGRITFPKLNFALPGAKAALDGSYVFATQELDFHGTARVQARLSQMMMTRWKRWLLKPVDPYFAKQGYGTVADFKIWGTRDSPQFGLDRGGAAR